MALVGINYTQTIKLTEVEEVVARDGEINKAEDNVWYIHGTSSQACTKLNWDNIPGAEFGKQLVRALCNAHTQTSGYIYYHPTSLMKFLGIHRLLTNTKNELFPTKMYHEIDI
jgi:hypothetical protein